MITDYELQRGQEIYNMLNMTKKQESNSPEFWLWSDLASAYPKFFDKSTLVPMDSFSENLHKTITQGVPAFENKTDKPTHIVEINTGTNQKLTRLACEYLCGKYYGAEFAQAYFLFPNTPFIELYEKVKDIKTYRNYHDIDNTKKRLAAIILRVTNQNQAAANNAFNIIWAKFLNVKNVNEFRQKYDVKHSPIDHIQPDQWRYVYYMFRDVILQLNPHTELDFTEIKQQSKESAQFARHLFEKYKQKPEDFLSTTDFSIKPKQIDMERKYFWLKNYYTNSL